MKKMGVFVMKIVAEHKWKILLFAALVFILFLASFYFDIGFLLTVLLMVFALIYVKKLAKTDKDYLQMEINQKKMEEEKEKTRIMEEMLLFKQRLLENPLDYDAKKGLENLEIQLRALERKKE